MRAAKALASLHMCTGLSLCCLPIQYGKWTKIMNISWLQKRPRQTWQTQIRSSLVRVSPVCYSSKHFVTSSPDNQYFIKNRKRKRVQNFRTFTVGTEIMCTGLYRALDKIFLTLYLLGNFSCFFSYANFFQN